MKQIKNKVTVIIANNSKLPNDPKELEKISHIYRKKSIQCAIESEASQELMVGYLLYQVLGITEDHQIRYDTYGKPYLADGKCYFNLSHSEEYCVLAVANCEVGIDIEKKIAFHQAAAAKVFTRDEMKKVSQLNGEQKDRYYTKIWTKHEAFLKAEGTGFAGDWTNKTDEAYCFLTYEFDDYYITCATKEMTILDIKHF